jgi:hypothetical protein
MYFSSSSIPGFAMGTETNDEFGATLSGYLYAIYWIPIVPACNLITNLVDPYDDSFAT